MTTTPRLFSFSRGNDHATQFAQPKGLAGHKLQPDELVVNFHRALEWAQERFRDKAGFRYPGEIPMWVNDKVMAVLLHASEGANGRFATPLLRQKWRAEQDVLSVHVFGYPLWVHSEFGREWHPQEHPLAKGPWIALNVAKGRDDLFPYFRFNVVKNVGQFHYSDYKVENYGEGVKRVSRSRRMGVDKE